MGYTFSDRHILYDFTYIVGVDIHLLQMQIYCIGKMNIEKDLRKVLLESLAFVNAIINLWVPKRPKIP
jgi:hypothetical protein